MDNLPSKWAVESFLETAGKVEDISNDDFFALCAVADTHEDAGLSQFDTSCWHIAVIQYVRKIASAILSPGGTASCVAMRHIKTKAIKASEATIQEWWPKIHSEILSFGIPKFDRLRALLVQERVRAINESPKRRTSLERLGTNLESCLKQINSLAMRRKKFDATPLSRVVLKGQGEKPDLDGKPVKQLTFARYNVVNALLQAGPNGLTKDELVSKSGHASAVNILKGLAESSKEWKAAIKLGKVTGGRYSLRLK